MRVLQVFNPSEQGGLETMLSHSKPHLEDLGVELDFFPIHTSFSLLPSAAFKQTLAEGDYQLVHSHLGYASGVVATACQKQGIPCVVSIHSSEPTGLLGWRDQFGLDWLRQRWLGWHRRQLTASAACFVGQSEGVLRNFCGPGSKHKRSYHIIENGVIDDQAMPSRDRARQQLGLSEEYPILLHVANVRRSKNYECLFDIAVEVRRSYPKMRLFVVGSGVSQSYVESVADAKGIRSSCHFPGKVKDLWTYYAAADVLVFPSWSDGCGTALIEGQWAGLPIVASDIDAHREALSPEQRDFLFSPEDPIQGARKVLQQLDGGTRNRYLATKKYVQERYSSRRYSQETARLYYSIV